MRAEAEAGEGALLRWGFAAFLQTASVPYIPFPGVRLTQDCMLFSLDAKIETKLHYANPGSALQLSVKRKIYLPSFEARMCLGAKVQIP